MANLRAVARDALGSVNDTWYNYLTDNDYDVNAADLPDDAYDHELGLYVYENGTWSIDHAQYLADHRNIASWAPITRYRTIRLLYDALRDNALDN